jgi:hypothetical protein
MLNVLLYVILSPHSGGNLSRRWTSMTPVISLDNFLKFKLYTQRLIRNASACAYVFKITGESVDYQK